MMRLLGYSDRISVAPGETITFMVSGDGVPRYRAGIVRLIHGDANPAGPGFKAEPLATPIDGTYPGRHQPIAAGSSIQVEPHPELAKQRSLSGTLWIWPTLLEAGPQAVLGLGDPAAGGGFVVGVDPADGVTLDIAAADGPVRLVTGRRLVQRHWYLVGFSIDVQSGRLTLLQEPLRRFPLTDDAGLAERAAGGLRPGSGRPLAIAKRPCPRDDGHAHYNGKIDSPRLFAGALPPDALLRLGRLGESELPRDGLIAAWDLARETSSLRVVDAGPHRLEGRCVNLPTRAMKGWRWTGEVLDWKQRPDHYGAIHFHADDIHDAGWQPDFTWQVPAGTRSGVYCAHLRSEDGLHEDYVPFCVRPPRGRATADIAFLLPTASYMAYANDHNAIDAQGAEMTIGRLVVLQPNDLHIDRHRELGLALYDSHADGSGVSISSRLRPILNMRPKFSSWLGAVGSGLWQFNADTHLVDWLEAKGFACDVITDEDLHQEGAALLEPYRVILTGTHPEYHSTPMWDAMQSYLDGGGRLMYLGANGWYWRIGWHKEAPGVIEVRRAEDGIRTWEAEPGEYYQAFDGEYGGLWRRNGRPPNVLLGIGFTAQGFDLSSYYRRLPGSFDPRAAFIFAGVGADERIGDFGLVGGGAAGLELDRVEPLLGTPPHTLQLAASEKHTDLYLLVNEEFGVTSPDLSGTQHPKVRADLAFFETLAGGAVFSVGSIAWCGSLSHNGYDNNVSRITENVLRRFRDPTPFAR
jgi:N,N-dimethylformamidase